MSKSRLPDGSSCHGRAKFSSAWATARMSQQCTRSCARRLPSRASPDVYRTCMARPAADSAVTKAASGASVSTCNIAPPCLALLRQCPSSFSHDGPKRRPGGDCEPIVAAQSDGLPCIECPERASAPNSSALMESGGRARIAFGNVTVCGLGTTLSSHPVAKQMYVSRVPAGRLECSQHEAVAGPLAQVLVRPGKVA
jgi:hypothetical protein